MDRETFDFLREFRDELRERLCRIERALYGNGGDGLVQKVERGEHFRIETEARYRLIFGAVVAALLSALAALARSLVR